MTHKHLNVDETAHTQRDGEEKQQKVALDTKKTNSNMLERPKTGLK